MMAKIRVLINSIVKIGIGVVLNGIIEEFDTNYLQLENGILIQWGQSSFNTGITIASGTSFVSGDLTVKFPISFMGNPFSFIPSFERTDRYGSVGVRYTGPGGAVCYAQTSTTFSSGYPFMINFIAIGKWK